MPNPHTFTGDPIIGPKLRGEKLKQFCLDLFADKAK